MEGADMLVWQSGEWEGLMETARVTARQVAESLSVQELRDSAKELRRLPELERYPDLGPNWELMKQDLPDYRLKTAQDRIAENNLAELRSKLTSWPALFSKRYEVARALALGWWHQLTPKEKSDMADKVVFGSFCFVMVVIAAWLALR